MQKPDVIIVFAFSKNGTANKRLAMTAKNYSERFNVPVFTQRDVAQHLKTENLFVVEENDNYLSTLKIVVDFKKMAVAKNWNKVLVIAAPPHQWRCRRDVKKFGFKLEKFSDVNTSSSWYNPEDPQPWVRNSWSWWTREIILRAMPWSIYKRILIPPTNI